MPERAEFDEILLSRARLGILSALASGDEMDFVYLREALELTDGNLGAQIRNLEGKGYIEVQKRFVERKPVTVCRITSKGREALYGLFRHLEEVLKTSNEPSVWPIFRDALKTDPKCWAKTAIAEALTQLDYDDPEV